MDSEHIKALTDRYIMNTYARFPVALDHGRGATLWDADGKDYIDFTSGIGVCSLGYDDPTWVDAIACQAAKLGHVSNLFYTEAPALLAQRLCERTGMSRVFFASGGGEANEGMIKLARKYSEDRYGEGRATIVTLKNSFHGRTIATLEATGQEAFHRWFLPYTGGFRYAEANSVASLKEVSGDDVCAVMVELVQGEGGVLPLDPAYVHELRALCDERDWLLLVGRGADGRRAHGRAVRVPALRRGARCRDLRQGHRGRPSDERVPRERAVPRRPRTRHACHDVRRQPDGGRSGACGAGPPDRRVPGRGGREGAPPARVHRGSGAAVPGRDPRAGSYDRCRRGSGSRPCGHR